jgi:hypothetical protein
VCGAAGGNDRLLGQENASRSLAKSENRTVFFRYGEGAGKASCITQGRWGISGTGSPPVAAARTAPGGCEGRRKL